MIDQNTISNEADRLYRRLLRHAEFVRADRGKGRLSEIDLLSGRSRGYFARILAGEIAQFNIHQLLKMLLVLGVDTRGFFAEAFGVCAERLMWELASENSHQVEYLKKRLRWAKAGNLKISRARLRHQVWELEERRMRERAAVKEETFQLSGVLASAYGSHEILELRCEVFGVLGAIHRTQGVLSSAAYCLGEALRISTRLAEKGLDERAQRSRAKTLQRVGDLAADTGELEHASTLLEAARELYLKLSDSRGVGRTLVDLGVIEGKSERHGEALEKFGQSLEVLPEDDMRQRFTALQGSGLCHLELGDIERAERFLDQALEVAAMSGSRGLMSFPLWLRSKIHCARGELAQAVRDLREIQRLYLEGSSHPLDLALVSLEIARLLWLQGNGEGLQELTSEMMPLLGRLEKSPLVLAAIEEFLVTALRGEMSLESIESATQKARQGSRGKTSLATPESLLDQPLSSDQGPAP